MPNCRGWLASKREEAATAKAPFARGAASNECVCVRGGLLSRQTGWCCMSRPPSRMAIEIPPPAVADRRTVRRRGSHPPPLSSRLIHQPTSFGSKVDRRSDTEAFFTGDRWSPTPPPPPGSSGTLLRRGLNCCSEADWTDVMRSASQSGSADAATVVAT